jgi:uncharacterized protein YlxW (UPF0749 family)
VTDSPDAHGSHGSHGSHGAHEATGATGRPEVAARTAWSRLLRAGRPRATRAQALAGVLTLALGFAVVTQVRQTQQEGLSALRETDLVRILDDVGQREARLEADARDLQATQERLQSGSDSSQAALEAAQARLDTLGVLTGTMPASGPGIRLTIEDPQGKVTAPMLLDALQELRDAGAEAVQIGSVRVVASTSFEEPGGSDGAGVVVDSNVLHPPYVFLAIGDPPTLSAALDIPGGVLETLRQQGATGVIASETDVRITALHTISPPRYARPAPTPSGAGG